MKSSDTNNNFKEINKKIVHLRKIIPSPNKSQNSPKKLTPFSELIKKTTEKMPN